MTNKEPLLDNDERFRAEALDPARSFIVQAPAGAGKTELLTQRFLRLLAEVDQPEQILAITFTIAATAEMRQRVLDSLQEALRTPDTLDEKPRVTAARAALRNDSARSWNLLEQPQRLNIQTIDSLCLAIAHQTPLLSQLGGSLSPTEHAEPLYALAARRTLAHLGSDRVELSNAIRALLELRETSLADCERLIADMLEQRDQWLNVALLGRTPDWQKIQSILEEPFARERIRVISEARALFMGNEEIARELPELLSFACANLESTGSDSPLLRLKDIRRIEQLTEHEHWVCLCEFLMTKQNGWRSAVQTKHGFPGGKSGKPMKDRFSYLIGSLKREARFQEILCKLRNLPPAQYSNEQWTLLRHILAILHHATAELRVLFAEQNVVDFAELGLAARHVLSENELPVELAERWPHLLVDEFQDTSRGQYELLSLLVSGWASTERGETATCFLVGDPMQSIYGFRQAEVELFERTKKHGLGEASAKWPLLPLALQMNFRSHAGLVSRLNETFSKIFATETGGSGYRVNFVSSIARDKASRAGAAVRVIPSFQHTRCSLEEKIAASRAEADEVVRTIQKHWPEVEAAKREGREFQIAVLARARPHLVEIVTRLRDARIPFRAVEIEKLNDRQEVLDLKALVRALMQPMDRIAWLSVLRAPWCGLTLRDLHTLCGSDDPEAAKMSVLELLRSRIPLLSQDGRQRASRTAQILEAALLGRHRQISVSRWVERLWWTLGGRECVDGTAYENVRAFFRMLEELPPDGTQFEQQLERLFAEPDPNASERSGVQLMTIHKAKGLGFDVVIVPGLHRKPSSDSHSLLRWLERTTLEGPEEEEHREFLVAPIGRKGAETDPLYQWITKQAEQKEAEEAKRLLYVACTRAKRELHLLGAAVVKTLPDGSESIEAGDRKSLLATAWPALEADFQQVWETRKNALAWEQRSLPFPSPEAQSSAMPANGDSSLKPRLQLRRLPADWKPPAHWTTKASAPYPEEEARSRTPSFERPAGSLKARALGITVHSLFEEVTRVAGEDLLSLRGQMDLWRPRAAAILRNAGLPRAEAERQSANAVDAVKSALEDEIGRWILSPKLSAQTETSWSAWVRSQEVEETLQTWRGDRIFRAGAEPGSWGATHTWIVDYKTAQRNNVDLENFLSAERERYQQQLATYGQLVRKIQGETEQLRLALYYPLLKKLLWWEG